LISSGDCLGLGLEGPLHGLGGRALFGGVGGCDKGNQVKLRLLCSR